LSITRPFADSVFDSVAASFSWAQLILLLNL
jgi:hypothetical protein